MRSSGGLKGLLVVAGLIATGIGAAILLTPEAFHESADIDLGGNVNLLSEIRAPGGALMATGLLMLAGAFVSRLTFTATVMTGVVYLSYGLSRVLSMAVDGMPEGVLVFSTVVEMVLGIAAAIALARNREPVQRLIGGSRDPGRHDLPAGVA